MAKNYPYRCQINYFGIATRNPSGSPTKWCPRSIAKLVNITPITMVSDTYYYTIRYKLSITMVSDTLINKLSIVISTINHSYWIYKPTYNWGAPHCTCFNQLSDSDLRPAPKHFGVAPCDNYQKRWKPTRTHRSASSTGGLNGPTWWTKMEDLTHRNGETWHVGLHVEFSWIYS